MATNANGNGASFGVTLRNLPLPVRLTLSLFLLAVGLGYFSALVQLHFQNASRGEPLPTPNDVVEIFAGKSNWPDPAAGSQVSLLEKLIAAPPEGLPHNGNGTMSFAFFKDVKRAKEKDAAKGERLEQTRQAEREAVLAWIRLPDAERKTAYDKDALDLKASTVPASLKDRLDPDDVEGDKAKVQSILSNRCSECHGDAGLQGKRSLVNYGDFESVLEIPGRQMTLDKLTETTHLHLLSFCMLWMLTGLIFAFSSYWKWLRCILAPLVLLAQVADVACWWLARLPNVGPYFALAIIGTGALVGGGLILQIGLSLLDMYKWPGRVVLVILFGAAVGAGVYAAPRVQTYLQQEKAPAAAAPAEK
jgi:hypothetical protein